MSTPLALEAAVAMILEQASPLAVARVETLEAVGRTIGEPVTSPIDSPPFDNSAMDGFALRAADTANATEAAPARLRLTGESRAGAPATSAVDAACAMRISTGAAMPEGTDAVLRVEDAVVEGGELLIRSSLERAHDVRPAGDDIARGETVLRSGTVVGAGELAMLASIGATGVTVHERPRVAIIATGDELVPPGEPLGPGQIHDSNSLMLAELVRAAGAELGAFETRVADNRRAVDAALASGLRDADVLIVCGGISKGEHDHVKAALADAGAEQLFWQVALRPGHPTWFGVHPAGASRRTLVFALPGNPVSAFVTFHLFVAPALNRLSGRPAMPPALQARYRGPAQHKRRGFAHAVRCRLRNDGDELIAELTSENQRSHALSSAVGVDAIALLAAASETLEDGQAVTLRLINN